MASIRFLGFCGPVLVTSLLVAAAGCGSGKLRQEKSDGSAGTGASASGGNSSSGGNAATGGSSSGGAPVGSGGAGAGGSGGAAAGGQGGIKGPPTWTALPSMITPRMRHTVTALADGRVLIVGGQYVVYDATAMYMSATKTLATAEVYDPVTETFVATGALASPRYSHTATLLPNGKVLITGGSNGTAQLMTAELYDPATGTFQPTGGLGTARRDHTATVLDNGKVFIAGGYSPTDLTATCEVYDPATGTFTMTGSMVAVRVGHTATRLKNGKVLVVGGGNFVSPPTFVTAELYDPATGVFSMTGALSARRDTHSATLLADGRVLIAGGRGNGSTSAGQGEFATAETYDPTTGTFTLTGSMATQRFAHTATILANGKVLIAGGQNQLSSYTALSSAEVFDPATGTFTGTGTLVNVMTAHRAVPLANGKVLLVGGQEAPNSVEVYDPATGTFYARDLARIFHTATPLADGNVLFSAWPDYINPWAIRQAVIFDPIARTFRSTGPMTRARVSHTATLLKNNKVLMVGSYPWSNTPLLLRADLYDPGTRAFTALGPTESRSWHTATLLPNGNVLLAGAVTPAYTISELYDAASATFTVAAPMLTGRAQHTATLLKSGKVLLVGGWGASSATGSTTLSGAELYDPVAGTFSATGPLATARNDHTASLLLDGRVLIVGGWSGSVTSGGGYSGMAVAASEVYDPETGTFSATGPLATGRARHAAVTLSDGKILIIGGSNSRDPSNQATEPTPLASAELYDPAVGSFTTAPSMKVPRRSPTATLLPDGKVLVVGGNAGGLNGHETVAAVELYW
ncbi:MAG: kelch repeat-containing protein [Myxococcales bacterium]